MARDYMDIGSVPASEDCAQLGTEDCRSKARAECNRFIELLRRTIGEEPEGASLAIKNNSHDFGSYLSVVCYFDDENEEACRYAYRCESEAPQEWDDAPAPGDVVNPDGSPTEYLGLPIYPGSTETKDNSGMMTCDFCPEEMRPVVDGRTKQGPWAAMCPDHFTQHGLGLGTGYGQKLVDPEESHA